MIRILIRLITGYGLGDCIQVGVVLKHLARHRPNWIVDIQGARDGRAAWVGLCNAVFTEEEPATGKYDQILDVYPHDALYNWDDRPNTKVTSMLHEAFGLGWDADLGRYEVHVTEPCRRRVMRTIPGQQDAKGMFKTVILHYQGGSSPHLKNLDHWQARDICDMILAAGRTPVIFDRDGTSPIPDGKTVFRAKVNGADELAAYISACEAYVGIDSGPGHVASATSTPALICWTKNHPVHFHDPAVNTRHLIPENHRTMAPANDDGVAAFFHSRYWYETYSGENGLVLGVSLWLAMHLNAYYCVPPQVFVIRHDRAAIAMALTKIRSVAQGRPIAVMLDGTHADEAEDQLVPFLKQFEFIGSVKIEKVGIQPPDKPTNTRGHFLYMSDGRHDGDNRFFLVPEAAVSQGKLFSLDWLPGYELDLEMLNHPAIKEAIFDRYH